MSLGIHFSLGRERRWRASLSAVPALAFGVLAGGCSPVRPEPRTPAPPAEGDAEALPAPVASDAETSTVRTVTVEGPVVRSTLQDAHGTAKPPFHHLEVAAMVPFEIAPEEKVTLLPLGSSLPTIVGFVDYFNGESADPPTHPAEGIAGVIGLRPVTDAAWLSHANRTGWFRVDVAVIYPRSDHAVALRKPEVAADDLPETMKLDYLTLALDGDGNGTADAMTFEYCLPYDDEVEPVPMHDECDVSAVEVHVLREGTWQMLMYWDQY